MFVKFTNDKKTLKNCTPACSAFGIFMSLLGMQVREFYFYAVNFTANIVIASKSVRLRCKNPRTGKVFFCDMCIWHVTKITIYFFNQRFNYKVFKLGGIIFDEIFVYASAYSEVGNSYKYIGIKRHVFKKYKSKDGNKNCITDCYIYYFAFEFFSFNFEILQYWIECFIIKIG